MFLFFVATAVVIVIIIIIIIIIIIVLVIIAPIRNTDVAVFYPEPFINRGSSRIGLFLHLMFLHGFPVFS
jgi:hypothetical protein